MDTNIIFFDVKGLQVNKIKNDDDENLKFKINSL